MQINFTDLAGAQKYHENYTHILGLGDRVLGGRLINHLNIEDTPDAKWVSEEFMPTFERIAIVGEWMKSLPASDSLLIHCLAGYSRSPAITIMALCLKNDLPFSKAYMEINRYRIPNVIGTDPNPLIIKFVKEYLSV